MRRVIPREARGASRGSLCIVIESPANSKIIDSSLTNIQIEHGSRVKDDRRSVAGAWAPAASSQPRCAAAGTRSSPGPTGPRTACWRFRSCKRPRSCRRMWSAGNLPNPNISRTPPAFSWRNVFRFSFVKLYRPLVRLSLLEKFPGIRTVPFFNLRGNAFLSNGLEMLFCREKYPQPAELGTLIYNT